MSDFPRAQKLAALFAVTAVVVLTLIFVNVSGPDAEVALPTPTVDPNATPTAVPILDNERMPWSAVSSQIRGAADTVSPVPCPFIDERERQENNFLSLTPSLTFVCDVPGLEAMPIAPGRVVMRVTQAPLNSQKAAIVANGKDGPWVRAAAYGTFVVIDHGALNGVRNVTSVYAGLDSISPDLRIGQTVDTSTPLGRIGRLKINDELVEGVLPFELLTDDTRFGSDPLRANPPPASAGPELAALLADRIQLPVTTCNLPFGNPDLNVGAPREYRSGTHNGLDFNCGTNDHVISSAASGQVIFVVNDYVDSSTEDRDAVLAETVPAFDTPFWTLAYLYGNFVVIDHELQSGDRAVTIYAHLSEVDPAILPGVLVDGGTPLGLVGNTGTSTAATGVTNNHGSVHLHWELHINDRPIGYLEDPSSTDPLYADILCNPNNPSTTVGC